MTPSYTPGPWRYDPSTQRVYGKSVGGSQLKESVFMLADVRGWGHLQYLNNGAMVQDANGRLLAAAPSLHRALKACAAVLAGETLNKQALENALVLARDAMMEVGPPHV